ncbi:hypothetical protein A9P82_04385 [Arachidicoccus ginsenosidimutans]|nr:hypothetical protein A9P82_04385 [Arachidicoccus sp. BS20]
MKKFFKQRKNITLIVLLLLCALLSLFSRSETLVENWYATGIYPFIGKTMRSIFGKIPFSIGDVFYTIFFAFVLFRIVRFFIKLFKRKIDKTYLAKSIYTLLFTVLTVYFLFYALWGMNYSRQGIAHQLQLNISQKYSTKQLDSLVKNLVVKTNAGRILLGKKAIYPNNQTMFNEALQAYANIEKTYPFLHYEAKSVKTSVYNMLNSYLGTAGYYNPFTGEAQVNTALPKFGLPYTTCHEMAHQLGYATEDEANFVGYLAASNSFDPLFKYSAYLNLYEYANWELWQRDSALAKNNYKMLDTLVKADLYEQRNYIKAHENPVEKLTTKIYSQYLKANHQPQGINTYNLVTAWLIAYERKYKAL